MDILPSELQKLQETKKIFQALVDNSPDCIKLFDTEGKLIFINNAGVEEHGLVSNEDAIAKGWNALETVAPEDRNFFTLALQNANRGEITTSIIHHTNIGSVRKSCSELIVPVMNEGKIICILGISRNISSLEDNQKEIINHLKQRSDSDEINQKRYQTILDQQKEIIRLKKIVGESPPKLEDVENLQPK